MTTKKTANYSFMMYKENSGLKKKLKAKIVTVYGKRIVVKSWLYI